MPKKFQGENTAAARACKADAKVAADAKRQQEQEDALWKDYDKHVLRKEQRKEDREKRRLVQLKRKKEAQRLLDEEAATLRGKLQKSLATPPKITCAQIEETLPAEEQEASRSAEKPKSHIETPLEENINRRVLEEETVEARTVEDAISVLSVTEELDRHPERCMKAAFAAYEELNMPCLKPENPTMRLSQLKQLLKKEWIKSTENPLNQRHVSYKAPK